jgi:hypothetical protein
MTQRFGDHGVGFAHLTLPADSYAEEVQQLLKAAGPLARISPHVCYLTGQSDVLLELEVSDFRKIFDLQYDSSATGTNWLFAVPYLPTAETNLDRFSLAYVMHLRVVRDRYRRGGVETEEKLQTQLRTLLKRRSPKIVGNVMAGFGWSDLIIAGQFSELDALTGMIKDVQHMRIEERLAFRRVLTLTGYDHDTSFTKSSDMLVSPSILIRTSPTRVREATSRLASQLMPGVKIEARQMDGKWDALLLPQDRMSARQFIKNHKKFVISGATFERAGMERLETHLLSQDLVLVKNVPKNAESISCSCTPITPSDDLRHLIERLQPTTLRRAVRNVLGLFRSASRDPHNCCDIARPLERSETNLLRLLHECRERKEKADGDDRPSYWSEYAANSFELIQEWCTFAERAVSQRTVGRFEEFLGQNERVVSYRGGVQKLLYLADSLLNSYAAHVGEGESGLVCLYDPIDTVQSYPHLGIVQIPARYLFLLPLAVNHLWHEVGTYSFHRRNRIPHQVLRERLKRVAEETGDSSVKNRGELTLHLADVYADALTVTFGFRRDLSRFTTALASALFESPLFYLAPPVVRERHLVHLLTRLYLASEYIHCLQRRDLGLPDEWTPPPLAAKIVIGSSARAIARLLDSPRYRGYSPIHDDMIDRAAENIRVCADLLHRPQLMELVRSVDLSRPGITAATQKAFEAIMNGNLVELAEFSIDINDIFYLLQGEMIAEISQHQRGNDVDKRSFFAPTAALLRSATLSFYRMEKGRPTDESTVAPDPPELEIRRSKTTRRAKTR